MKVRRIITVEGEDGWVQETLHKSLVSPDSPFHAASGSMSEIRRVLEPPRRPRPRYVQVCYFMNGEVDTNRRWDYIDGVDDGLGYLIPGDRVWCPRVNHSKIGGIVVALGKGQEGDFPYQIITDRLNS